MPQTLGAATAELGASCELQHNNDADLLLEYADGRLQLRDTRDGAPGPLFVDLHSDDHARRQQAGRQLPLARAVGVKVDQQPSVIDATAGFGRDAWVLHQLGCDVRAIENSPLVAALLEDGLKRANAAMNLAVGDAREILQTCEPPQVVYIDPMFPERRKSAAVKKEMQYLQALLGEDDVAGLFKAAMGCALQRVVVKRPSNAKPVVVSPKPNHTFEGKTVRFDVYLT